MAARISLRSFGATLLALALITSARSDAEQRIAHRHATVPVTVSQGPTQPAPAPSLSPDERGRAEGIYERACLPCHGPRGEGNGPLARYLVVRPRDFVHEPYRWRSTPSGTMPTVDDVARTISRGVPGAGMPAFGPALARADRTLLARYVLAFQSRAPGVPIAPSPLPTATPALLARGAEVYRAAQCAGCHGATLRGDGPNASLQNPRPYDLTQTPPRGGGDAESILRALRTGLDGTTMPAFDGAIAPADLAALAEWLASSIPPEVASRRAPNDPGPDHWLGDDAPNAQPLAPSGLLDADRTAREQTYWSMPLAAQGDGPPQLTPAERSLSPDRCGRCHAEQLAQFRPSIHAAAMGPGVLGQLIDMPARDVVACQMCHAPLAEQSPFLPSAQPANASMPMQGGPSAASSEPPLPPNPAFDAELRVQGVVCAACHLRGRARFGPPLRPSSGLLPSPMYPLTTLSRFERGDFCAPCHQHTPADSAGGHPILDTVDEWLDGPYFARGIQCQHCHMPSRAHTFRGAHDPETVREAVHVYGAVRRDGTAIVGEVSVENVGAAHAFPGTATPAAVLTLEWLDAAGARVGDAVADVMQRHLEWNGTRFDERFDTRIRPGASRTVRARSTDARAVRLHYTLVFRPDDYYRGFYEHEIARPGRSDEGRRLLRLALDHARASEFVIRDGSVALAP